MINDLPLEPTTRPEACVVTRLDTGPNDAQIAGAAGIGADSSELPLDRWFVSGLTLLELPQFDGRNAP
jgi:hypothetical protein